MSTLQVNTVRHNTSGFNNVITHADGGGTENAKHARAYVNFDGQGTVTIRANFNVNSITDNGTGDYTVNFSNAMSDALYSVNMSNQTNPASGPDTQTIHYARTPNTQSAPTSSAFRISVMIGNGSAVDRDYVSCTIFR
jgi:hypothetical protein